MDCKTLRQNFSILLKSDPEDPLFPGLQEHLEKCWECDHYVRMFGGFNTVFRDLSHVRMPKNFTQQVVWRFQKMPPKKRFRKERMTMISFLILLILGAAFFIYKNTPSHLPFSPDEIKIEKTAGETPLKSPVKPEKEREKKTAAPSKPSWREKEELEKIRKKIDEEHDKFKKSVYENIEKIIQRREEAKTKGEDLSYREFEETIKMVRHLENKRKNILEADLTQGKAMLPGRPPSADAASAYTPKLSPSPQIAPAKETKASAQESGIGGGHRAAAQEFKVSTTHFHWHVFLASASMKENIKKTFSPLAQKTVYESADILILEVPSERLAAMIEVAAILPEMAKGLKKFSEEKRPDQDFTFSLVLASPEKNSKLL